MCLPYLLFTVTTGLLWWILQKSSIWRLKKLETTVAIATLTVCLSRVEFKSGFPVAVWCSVLVSGLRCRNHWKMCVSGTKRPERLLRAGAEQRKWLVSIASAVKVLCAASVFCLFDWRPGWLRLPPRALWMDRVGTFILACSFPLLIRLAVYWLVLLGIRSLYHSII